jgi:hypothetical protein
MNIIHSKKGDAFKILNYGFWRLVFISTAFLVIYLLAASKTNITIDVGDLKATLFSQRVVNSANGITSNSDYSSTYSPGIISSARFSDEIVSRQFNDSSDKFSASILVENIDAGTQDEVFVNKRWFERYYPLAKFEKYDSSIRWRYVLIENTTMSKGRMLIKTVENG